MCGAPGREEAGHPAHRRIDEVRLGLVRRPASLPSQPDNIDEAGDLVTHHRREGGGLNLLRIVHRPRCLLPHHRYLRQARLHDRCCRLGRSRLFRLLHGRRCFRSRLRPRRRLNHQRHHAIDPDLHRNHRHRRLLRLPVASRFGLLFRVGLLRLLGPQRREHRKEATLLLRCRRRHRLLLGRLLLHHLLLPCLDEAGYLVTHHRGEGGGLNLRNLLLRRVFLPRRQCRRRRRRRVRRRDRCGGGLRGNGRCMLGRRLLEQRGETRDQSALVALGFGLGLRRGLRLGVGARLG